MNVSIVGLSYTYGQNTPFKKDALDNINLTIGAGEFIGLIGHTGSGKSTLIQHLNGLLKPSSGRILIDGNDIWKDAAYTRAVRFRVGLVFQFPEYQLFEETVFRDVAFGPKNMGLSEKEIEQRVKTALELVGLPFDLCDKSPFELSGGQKRRVAIAGVMAMRPDMLILDEPTAGLDPKGRNDILDRIKDYHKATSATVILVSHSMEDVANTAKRLIVMNKGKVALDGAARDIFKNASLLNEIGLDIPEITRVLKSLKGRGFNLCDNLYTVDEAKEEILRLLSLSREVGKC